MANVPAGRPLQALSSPNQWGGRDFVFPSTGAFVRTTVEDFNRCDPTPESVARGVGPDGAVSVSVIRFTTTRLVAWRIDLANAPVAVRLAVLQAALEAKR